MERLSQATAGRVWNAHREIEVAEKLKAEILQHAVEPDEQTPIDHWSRRRQCELELAIPTDGAGGGRLYKIGRDTALLVIDAHIEKMKDELADASQVALLELQAEG